MPSANVPAGRGTGMGFPAAIAGPNPGPAASSTAMMRAAGRRAFTAVATPPSRPPPPTGTMTASTPGRSSTISRPAVPAPASTTGSSNGCTNVNPRASRTSASLANSVLRSSWKTISAPYARTASTFDRGASEGITTTHGASTLRAAHATAWAWFPADTVTRPCSRSSWASERTLFRAPRALNDPVFWKLSHLRNNRMPARSPSEAAESRGVRWTVPEIRRPAAWMWDRSSIGAVYGEGSRCTMQPAAGSRIRRHILDQPW